MPILPGSNESSLVAWDIPIVGTSSSSGVFASRINDTGVDQIVNPGTITLEITTQSGAASTLDIGIAADETTSNDRIIDGLSGAAAGYFAPLKSGGTNGGVAILWAAGTYLNVAEASGNVDALVAVLRLHTQPRT